MHRTPRIFAVALLALSVFAAGASADDITGGDLFAVVSRSGEFSGSASVDEMYAVFHLIRYAPTPPSEFPNHLVPLFFPAPFDPLALGAAPSAQFFLIGALPGGEGFPDHLILSSDVGPGVGPFPEASTLHDDLVAGTQGLVSDLPAYDISAAEFWSLYGGDPDNVAKLFFGGPSADFPVAPVRQLATFSFSEDLFGFEPPFSLGMITASPAGTTYTDPQGNTYTSVPEPALPALALTALAFLAGTRFRRRRA